MKNEVLNKPNQLINLITENKITATERKAYNTMLKYAQNKLKFEEHQSNVFKIPRYILHKKANLKNDNNEQIYKKLENLMKTVVRIFRRNEEHSKEWEASFTLLSTFSKTDDDMYKFELNHYVMEALKEQEFFTTLNLIMINSLSSQYSIIFYELAIKYKKVEIPKMSIEEVRKLTNTQNEYKRFYDFRKYVLNTACDEISEKTNIRLSYDTEKIGRKIAYIKFNIEKKEQKIPIEIENQIQSNKYPKNVSGLFELLPQEEQIPSNKETLNQLLQSYEYKYIKADIKYAKEFEPKNFMGFLKSSAEQGHFGKGLLEKQKKEEEKAKKRKKAEKERKQLIEEIEQQAKEEAKEKYQELSEEEREEYLTGYDELPDFLDATEEEYIIGSIEDELKEKMKRKEGII